jgi:hypothetical protein
MKNNTSIFKNTIINKIIFVLSILACMFWILGQMFNVYNYALIGIIYEIFWLPCIISIVCIPIICTFLLVKEKLNLRSLNIYSVIIIVMSILIILSIS